MRKKFGLRSVELFTTHHTKQFWLSINQAATSRSETWCGRELTLHYFKWPWGGSSSGCKMKSDCIRKKENKCTLLLNPVGKFFSASTHPKLLRSSEAPGEQLEVKCLAQWHFNMQLCGDGTRYLVVTGQPLNHPNELQPTSMRNDCTSHFI